MEAKRVIRKRGSLATSPRYTDAQRAARKKARAGIALRKELKSIGSEAAIKISRARVGKVKKDLAIKTAEQYKFESEEGFARAKSLTRNTDIGHYNSNNVHAIVVAQEGVGKHFRKRAKTYTSKAGGFASGMKRNAEAGIEKISTGKALKRAGKSAGVLGIVGMFLNELSISKNRKG